MNRLNHHFDVTRVIITSTFLAVIARYVPFVIDFGLFALTPVRVFMLLTFILAVAAVVNNSQISISRTEVYLIFLLILLTLSGSWAWYKLATVSEVFNIIFPVLLFFGITISGIDRRMLNSIWTGFILFAVFLLAVFIISSVISPYRDFSLFRVSYNQFARDVNAVLPFILGTAFLHHRRYIRYLAVSVGIALFTTIILVQSRSGFVVSLLIVALVAVVYLYWTQVTGRDWRLRIVAVMTLILSVISGALISGEIVPNRLMRVPTSVQTFNSEVLGEYRYRMYDFALSTLADNWLFGIGYGSFKPAMEAATGKGLIIHNFMLSVWIGGGLFAVALLLLFCSSVFYSLLWLHRQSLQQGAQTRAIKLLIVLIAFIGLVTNGLVNPILLNPVLYLLAASSTAMLKMRRFKNSETKL